MRPRVTVSPVCLTASSAMLRVSAGRPSHGLPAGVRTPAGCGRAVYPGVVGRHIPRVYGEVHTRGGI